MDNQLQVFQNQEFGEEKSTMAEELIPINYDSNRPTVSARELHDFLEVLTPFDKWFPRMAEYGFSEGTDYATFLSDRIDGKAGKPRQDAQLTIDMAKELCMIQRTEKGKQARQYFIQVEKSWNSPEQVMARALKMADAQMASLKGKNKQLTEKVEQDKPKVLFADAVTTAKSSILVGELAKLIRQNGYPIGQKRLFQWLRANGYLNTKGEEYNTPSQYSMERGLMEIKKSTVNNPDGSVFVTKTPKVTGKGQQYFINKFLHKGKEA